MPGTVGVKTPKRKRKSDLPEQNASLDTSGRGVGEDQPKRKKVKVRVS